MSTDWKRRGNPPRFVLVAVILVFGVATPQIAIANQAPTTASTASTAKRLFGFDDKEAAWVSVNDGVMGGVSSGRVSRKDGVLTFYGRVSLKNNGGFASTRSSGTVPPVGSDSRAFVVRTKGDGATYQFTVDTDEGWFWAATTPTKGSWGTTRVGFSDLRPVTRFGEPTKRRAFNGSQKIVTVGVLIANKRAEKFTLALDWIDVDV
jgi:NADH dehydrogenase [ubiquinone] 1 alpha subcomplex assembly factor 1